MSSGTVSASYATSAKADAGEAFVSAFVVCLVLISLPIKNFGYIVPPVFVVLQLLAGNFEFVRRFAFWLCLAVCLSALTLISGTLLSRDVNLPGVFMAMFTYSTLFVMVALRSDFAIAPELRERLNSIVAWWAIVQSIVGLGQYALFRNGDAVCGTMGLFEASAGRITITQVYFTFNLFGMILYMLSDTRGLLTKAAIVLSLITSALAQSGHQTVLLIVAVAIVAILQMRFTGVLKLLALTMALVALTFTLSETYWSDITGWYEKTMVDESSPKRMVASSAREIMASPKSFLLGVGMGQFGSRAALITSGEYLTIPIPDVLVGESEYYRDFVLPALYAHQNYGEHSAMSKPYSSVLNVLVEFGGLVSLFLLWRFAGQYLANRRLSRSTDKRMRAVAILANVGLVFLFLCCFIENYIEFPQAIFLPTLLYVAARTGQGGSE